MFDPNQHHRRSVRFAGYDYRNAGAYFVTICAHHKRPVFGRCENGVVQLHVYGQIVAEEWERTAQSREYCSLDEWIVMPNHFHAIILLTGNHGWDAAASGEVNGFSRPVTGSLSTVIGAFKSAVTRRVNAHRAARDWPPVEVWQRGFYERIIRNEQELN